MNSTKEPYDAIQSWIFGTALPFWAERGVDRRHGGYVEQLTFAGKDAGVDFKRTRVTCRQIYVFAHAAVLGWKEGLELARHGFDYLTKRTWMAEGGFARRLTRDGELLDGTADLYDYAFALFACGWWLRASGDKEALAWAHKTLDVIEAKLMHPSGLGFWHEHPPTGWRQQNPHMHLLEAALAVYEPSKDERFARLASTVAKLFATKFFDMKSQTLAEFFSDDWSRAPGDDGRIIEPGHQFEWAWILQNCGRLGIGDYRAEARALVAFGEKHGIDPESFATYNQVRDDGAPLDRGSRSWPNTERLKAAVALFEIDRKDPDAVFAQSGGLLLNRHLSRPTPGAWIDTFDGDGKPTAKIVPASTLYHVFLAFSEVLRVREAVTRS